jgi:uncharacterized protein (TIGR02145 family)
MRKVSSIIAICILFATLTAQTVNVSLLSIDKDNIRIPFDSVVVSNISQNWQATIQWPDTVLSMLPTGIDDFPSCSGFSLSQAGPNPSEGVTSVNIHLPEPGDIFIVLSDLSGRRLDAQHACALQPGIQPLKISMLHPGVYILAVSLNGNTASVKILNMSTSDKNAVELEAMTNTSLQKFSGITSKGDVDLPFNIGDMMEFVGFATANGAMVESATVAQELSESQTILLQFDNAADDFHGIPCPGMATVMDIDSNIYNTVQIGTQCWMKENMRTTHYADGTEIPFGSSGSFSPSNYSPYRFSPSEDENYLITYGYLYNWPAAMHEASSSNAVPSGVQGLCPTGWHVPSKAEWDLLASYVGSQSEYVCGGNTVAIAKSLASTTSWVQTGGFCVPGSTDMSSNNTTGFSARAASFGDTNHNWTTGGETFFWSSTEDDQTNYNACCKMLILNSISLGNSKISKPNAASVRCLHD